MANHRALCFTTLGLALLWPVLRRENMEALFGGIGNLASSYWAGVSFFIATIIASLLASLVPPLRRFVAANDTATIIALSLMTSIVGLTRGLENNLVSNVLASQSLFPVTYGLWFVVIVGAWGNTMTLIERQKLLPLILVSFILSFFIDGIIYMLGAFRSILAALSPIVSAAFWLAGNRAVASEPASSSSTSSSKLLWAQIAVIIAFLLIGGIARGLVNFKYASTSSFQGIFIAHAVSILVAAVLLVFVLLNHSDLAFYRKTWTILTVFLLICLTAVILLNNRNGWLESISSELISVSRTCFSVLLWMMLSLKASTVKRVPRPLFQLCYATVEAFSALLSYWLVPLLASVTGVSLVAHISDLLIVVTLMVFVAILAFMNASFKMMITPTELSISEAAFSVDAPRQRCDEIAKEASLSKQETEIMYLLSQGHSQKKIASLLFLSYSTVQSYCKSLYLKLGVHKKQEVIDLIHDVNEQLPSNRSQ